MIEWSGDRAIRAFEGPYMRFFDKTRLRIRSLSSKRRLESELSDEVSFHLDRLIDEKIGQGISPKEARYAALRELGGVDQIKEECRDMRRMNSLDSLLNLA